MKLRLESYYLITMLLLALLLALTIGIELDWGPRISLPMPMPQKTKVAALPLQREFGLPPLEQNYTEMLARPFFVPTRRPPPPVPIDAPQSAMRKGQFYLVGVILDKGKNIAILQEITNGKVSRVEQGKEINGMQLEKLEPEKITFKQGEDREEVVLKFKFLPKIQHLPQPVPAGTAVAPVQSNMLPPGMTGVPVQPGTPAVVKEPYDPQAEIARRRAIRGLPP